jgi:hypothetical protein
VCFVEGQTEAGGQITAKGQVAVGFSPAKTVVQVGGVQHKAQFCAALGECAEEGYGIRAPGETDGETKSGFKQGYVDGKPGAHQRMIAPEAPEHFRARE